MFLIIFANHRNFRSSVRKWCSKVFECCINRKLLNGFTLTFFTKFCSISQRLAMAIIWMGQFKSPNVSRDRKSSPVENKVTTAMIIRLLDDPTYARYIYIPHVRSPVSDLAIRWKLQYCYWHQSTASQICTYFHSINNFRLSPIVWLKFETVTFLRLSPFQESGWTWGLVHSIVSPWMGFYQKQLPLT